MPDGAIAYLTSLYGWAGDTFIRREVQALRALGLQVHTFGIRRPPADQIVDAAVRREYEGTDYLLPRNPAGFFVAMIRQAIRAPRRTLRAMLLARRVRQPGLKALIWHGAYLLEAAYLAGRLRALGVRHLHNHIAEGSATVAMLASEMSGIPFSLTVHGPYEFDKPEAIAMPAKIAKAAFVVAITDYAKGQLCRWAKVEDWSKIHVVHCGVDRMFLEAPLTPPSAAPRLVCVGRLCAEKGQLLLVQAAAKLAAAGTPFELTLIGDGPIRGELERLVRTLGLEGRVRLAGWQSSQAIRQALADSRALVLPSFAEGLPVVIMEALALGRPVISTYVAGIPELVEPGKTGWLIPAGSLDALVTVLGQALAAPVAQLAEMGRLGAQRVAERHDAAREAAKLAALIGLPPAQGAAPAGAETPELAATR